MNSRNVFTMQPTSYFCKWCANWKEEVWGLNEDEQKLVQKARVAKKKTNILFDPENIPCLCDDCYKEVFYDVNSCD